MPNVLHHLVAILKCLWVPILGGILMYYLILRFSIWMVNFFECHVSSIFLCRVPTITNKWTHLFDCGFCCGLSFSVNSSSVTHSNCTWTLRSRVLKLWTTGQLLPVVTFPATHRHHKDGYLNSFTIIVGIALRFQIFWPESKVNLFRMTSGVETEGLIHSHKNEINPHKNEN